MRAVNHEVAGRSEGDLMRSGRLVGLVALTLIVAATGCSPSVAQRTERGIPEGLVAPDEEGPSDGILGTSPFASWVDRDETFAVVTFGSSSCPPTPVRIEATADDRVEVAFDPPNGVGACTADLGPTTHVFALPEEAIGRPLSVVAVFTDDGSTRTFTLDDTPR